MTEVSKRENNTLTKRLADQVVEIISDTQYGTLPQLHAHDLMRRLYTPDQLFKWMLNKAVDLMPKVKQRLERRGSFALPIVLVNELFYKEVLTLDDAQEFPHRYLAGVGVEKPKDDQYDDDDESDDNGEDSTPENVSRKSVGLYVGFFRDDKMILADLARHGGKAEGLREKNEVRQLHNTLAAPILVPALAPSLGMGEEEQMRRTALSMGLSVAQLMEKQEAAKSWRKANGLDA